MFCMLRLFVPLLAPRECIHFPGDAPVCGDEGILHAYRP